MASARKSPSRSLASESKRFRLLLDLNPAPMWLLEPRTLRFVEVNEAALKKFGRTRAEFASLKLSDLWPPEQLSRLKKSFSALSHGRGRHFDSIKHRTKSGRTLELELDAHLVRWQGGDAVLAVIHDVTKQKTVEAALRGAERASIDGMAVLDAKRRYVYVNEAYAKIYGAPTAAELLGKPWRALCPERELKRFEDELMRGLSERGWWRGEAPGLRADGTEFPLELSMTAIEGGGFVIVARDITQRKQSEAEHERLLALERVARAEAEAANRAKDEFLAVLSHELRTPMTAVLGWTWLLRAGDVQPSEQAKALEIIERNMKLQAQIIEDLLDVSSIITGKLHLQPRPVRLDSVLASAVEANRAGAEGRGVAIEAALEPVSVYGDAHRLQQVFWNLLSNAVKFNKDGGSVRVTARRDSGCALVTVEDTGEGIGAEFLSAVFDPFRQAEDSLTRKHRGLGLGLAIVRHLVELHGGGVSAASEGQGKGATFTVALPLSPEPAAEKGARSEEASRSSLRETLSGIRVLLVDDEPDTLQMLGELLRFCGADVDLALSSAEALEAFERRVPQVLVSDISMPFEDGYSLLAKLRARGPGRGGGVHAVALTARAKDEDRQKALEAGFQLWLAKPVEPRQLVSAIRSLAGRPERV